MPSKFQVRRKINGTGAPGTAGILEGELALAFPGAAGTTTKPEFWAFDGTGWRRVNPDVTISTQSIPLGGTVTGGIGAAYNTWIAGATNNLTGNVVIATYGTPAQAYVLTDAAQPGVSGSWTSLGGAVSFAAAADIVTGSDTTKAVNSAGLRGAGLNAPSATPGNDANHFILLDANGKIASGFLPALPSEVRAAVDVTTQLIQPTPPYKSGDIVFVNKAGTVETTWTGAAGQTVESGDSLLFDGTNWHHIPNATDLSAYVPLAGTAQMAGNVVWATDQTGNDILDGKNGNLKDFVIDCGTYP